MAEERSSPSLFEVVTEVHLRNKIPLQCKIIWTIGIKKFTSQEQYKSIRSKDFEVVAEGGKIKKKLYLSIYPNGHSENYYLVYRDNNKKFVALFLMSDVNLSVKCSLAFLDNKGQYNHLKSYNSISSQYNLELGSREFIERSYLLNTENGLVENGNIRVVCEINPEHMVSPTYWTYSPKLLQLSNDYKKMFEEGELTDVTISVKDNLFKAHKAILCARSSVFADILEQKRPQKKLKKDVIHVSGVEPGVMYELLRYMYTGKFNNLEGTASSVLPIAHKYNLTPLKFEAEEVLSRKLSVQNAAPTLILADECDANILKLNAVKFINRHRKDVIRTSGWKSVADRPSLILQMYLSLFDEFTVLDQNENLTAI